MNAPSDVVANPDTVLCRISQTSMETMVDALWKLAAVDLEDELTDEFVDTAFKIVFAVQIDQTVDLNVGLVPDVAYASIIFSFPRDTEYIPPLTTPT
jgi:hypothetical protein